MVALNGTHLNGTPLHGCGLAHSTFPADVAAESTPRSQPEPADAERIRLVSEIVEANERAASASARSGARERDVRAVLHAEFVAAREALAEMEREHDAAIANVRTRARADTQRILAHARELATRFREEAGSGGPSGGQHAD